MIRALPGEEFPLKALQDAYRQIQTHTKLIIKYCKQLPEKYATNYCNKLALTTHARASRDKKFVESARTIAQNITDLDDILRLMQVFVLTQPPVRMWTFIRFG